MDNRVQILPELVSGRWHGEAVTEGPLHRLRRSPSPSKLGEDL